jgi:hypothetical protein
MVISGAKLIASVKSEMAPLKSPVLPIAIARLKYAAARSFALVCPNAMIVEHADIRSLKSLSLLAHARAVGGGSAAAVEIALNVQTRIMKKRARNDPPSKHVGRQFSPVCEEALR